LSGLLGLTPTLGIVLRNPLLGKRHPLEGEALAVVDTGYEGFIALPREVFALLSFDELQSEKRELVLANGGRLSAEGAYGAFSAPGAQLHADGFVETYEGLQEVLLGVEALSRARVLLDYCNMRMTAEPCP
jgi:clan AA aspartic protease